MSWERLADAHLDHDQTAAAAAWTALTVTFPGTIGDSIDQAPEVSSYQPQHRSARKPRRFGRFTVLAALVFTLAFLFGASLELATTSASAGTGLRPCVTEDDPGPCYWDAMTMGNGRGRSFEEVRP